MGSDHAYFWYPVVCQHCNRGASRTQALYVGELALHGQQQKSSDYGRPGPVSSGWHRRKPICGIGSKPNAAVGTVKGSDLCERGFCLELLGDQGRGEQNWYDSFKYIENMSPKDSEESAALRELSKHMINQAMDSRVVALEESVELAPKLEAFRDKMNGGELTPEEIDEMRTEFVKLNNAAECYLKSGKERLVKQITPFVSSMRDVSSANLAFLDALKADLGRGYREGLGALFRGQAAYEQSQEYGFDYKGKLCMRRWETSIYFRLPKSC